MLMHEELIKDGYCKEFIIPEDKKADKYKISYSCNSIKQNSFLSVFVTCLSGEKCTYILPVQFCGDISSEIEFPSDTSLVQIKHKGSDLTNFTCDGIITPYMEFVKEKASTWDKIQDVINQQGKLRADMMEGIINLTMNAFANEGGTITQENGVMTFLNGTSPDNSTQAVQITGGAIRVASQKNSSGEWDWKTAITGAGINAECVNAGTLTGMWIQGGQIDGTIIKGCQARFGIEGYAYTDLTASGDLNSYYCIDGKKNLPTVRLRKAREGRLELGSNLDDINAPSIQIHSVAGIPFMSDVTGQQPEGSSISASGDGLDITYGSTHVILFGDCVHVFMRDKVIVHGDVFVDGQLEVSGGIMDNAH